MFHLLPNLLYIFDRFLPEPCLVLELERDDFKYLVEVLGSKIELGRSFPSFFEFAGSLSRCVLLDHRISVLFGWELFQSIGTL